MDWGRRMSHVDEKADFAAAVVWEGSAAVVVVVSPQQWWWASNFGFYEIDPVLYQDLQDVH
jgi:hypothetical protein